MTSVILSVTRASNYERRREIAQDADSRQDDIGASILRSGFEFDWPAILAATDGASELANAIENEIHIALRGSDFRDTIGAVGLNGRLLAAYVMRRHEQEVGIQDPPPIELREADVFTPQEAVAYWKRLLRLTDEQAAQLLARLQAFATDAPNIAARVALGIMEPITALIAETIEKGLPLAEFLKRAREILPDRSRALLETEYRTELSKVYSRRSRELLGDRVAVFPFAQFMAVRDDRTTWYCCLPMGTAGPQGRGYIVAVGDPVMTRFAPPLHFRCRSLWSWISYREAQRLGIIARDGRTKIALVGRNPNRPYGDPPKFAESPTNGTLREVAPAPGFGG